MFGVGKWIGSAVLALIGLLALALVARANDAGMILFGFLLACFAVLMLFRLITLAYGDKENRENA